MTDGQTNLAPAQAASPIAQRRMIAISGAVFGLFLIFGVGFANPDVLHNAAHDSRHSFAFPCH